ncbi:Cyclic AMP receptor-like protein A-like protein [Hapsidospora chrysogenum ATCC 11550]|uniref:Cyclic AMP receptor-like protein A-like protein n=1 Tax=Hapsidospora chrysogenum (strain ATCC 11550 / CBS 779.69 / DSM 880 / IAM 14645 / JCM 23072 / IMI 49137) TaxID=857340 RepID=A0A086T4F6_HAPC1|nr:Cyclic AMP receptor-like protein A-like protein [Hapsidospora chrysogenum ATCC 11550]
MAPLTPEQLEDISIIERACSVISLLGSLFVIVTFCLSRSFHKPVNRLVFYATFGNMLTNVGTLMSRTYVNSPDSVGCQFQSFLIQMFMPADAFWILAMAINVYLTFYYRFDAHRLRRMEVPYLICCYGIPLIPATVYLFVRNSNGQRVYGDAVLWCWVVPEWMIWRILTFYGPVWILILTTFFIYIRAGRTIYYKRKQLQNFSVSETDPISLGETMATIKTTEITVTTTPAEGSGAPLRPLTRSGPNARGHGEYAVTIAACGSVAYVPPRTYTRNPKKVTTAEQGAGAPPGSQPPPPAPHVAARRRNYELNNAAWAYAKCAFLFFTALLITWIPSSTNRVYSVIHGGSLPALEFMSAFVLPLQGFWNCLIYATTSWTACKNLWHDVRHGRRPEVADLVGGMAAKDNESDLADMMNGGSGHHRNHNYSLDDIHLGGNGGMGGGQDSPMGTQSKMSRRIKKDGESESMTELANRNSDSDSGR